MNAADFWTHESVRSAMAGTWLARPTNDASLSGGASIDTRETRPGEVFFALRGERTDGHRFLSAAHRAGAGLAVIDDPDASHDRPEGLPIVKVTDVRAALGRLAAAYRTSLGTVRAIAVTGSNGKTTTTRMIESILSGVMRGTASQKSYNNDLGVPLTVLSAERGDQYLLCEVGMNAPGEIEPLSRIVRPHVAVVTSIGRAHIEHFGSLEGIASEKVSVAAHLDPQGVVVLPADSAQALPYMARFERAISFGVSERADLRVGEIEVCADGVRFAVNGRDRFEVPVPGAHNALNACAAIAVARRLGVEAQQIREGLASFRPADMRLSVDRLGEGVCLVNDAYNANPDSMLAAVRTLGSIGAARSRRVAILGDMLELGETSAQAHREIGETIVAEGLVSLVALVGADASRMRAPLERGGVETLTASDAEPGAATLIIDAIRPGDTVLLKGSRGVRLERIGDAIRKRFGAGVVTGGTE